MKNNVDAVDILKGIGIIAVVIGHSTMFTFVRDLKILNILIYAFHMPLFFIVGGFFLNNKINFKIFIKLLRRLILPFLIVSFIWAIFGSLFVQLPNYFRSSELYPIKYDINIQISKFFRAIIFGSKKDIIGTGVWFLCAFFLAKLIWYILHGVFNIKISKIYIVIIFLLNVSLHNYLSSAPPIFIWMWPQAILGYFFMIIGNWFYKQKIIEKIKYTDIVIFAILSYFLILWNGRVDMLSYGFNIFWLFTLNAILAFLIIFKFSFFLQEKLGITKTFLIWCGKNSLNILLFHPFFLTIASYSLISNFDVKNLYTKTAYLFLLYILIFTSVYCYNWLKKNYKLKLRPTNESIK